jgi:hypothetical protein
MKKLLSLLGAIGLVATSSATVVSCDNGDKDSSNAGDFTTDLSKVAGDKTDALVEVIKTQFKNTDGIADAQVMIFDTIDNANKAEDVINFRIKSSTPEAKIKGCCTTLNLVQLTDNENLQDNSCSHINKASSSSNWLKM